LFGQGFGQSPNLETSAGGNAVTTAYAVDYDMWYQYGFRASKSIEVPFFQDPESQCAPYAVARLTEQRKNILRGTAEVGAYNEYYQAGDVVYIEDRNLLFYVQDVKQAFSYGKLTTKLSLTYGHSPGEYIPTMLDTIGKILYNSRGFTGQFRSQRQKLNGSMRSLGAVILDNISIGLIDSAFSAGQDSMDSLMSGRFGSRNKNILSNALFSISGSLNQIKFQSRQSKIKIVYYKTDGSDADAMEDLALKVKDWLISPEEKDANVLSPKALTSGDGSAKQKTFGINDSDIIIEMVDFTDAENQTREQVYPESTDPIKNLQGPSRAAFQAVKVVNPPNNTASVAGQAAGQAAYEASKRAGPKSEESQQSSNSEIRITLANSVIDLFVDYSVPTDDSVSSTDGSSQSGQKANAEVDDAKNAKAGTTVDDNNPTGDPLIGLDGEFI